MRRAFGGEDAARLDEVPEPDGVVLGAREQDPPAGMDVEVEDAAAGGRRRPRQRGRLRPSQRRAAYVCPSRTARHSHSRAFQTHIVWSSLPLKRWVAP